MPGATREISTCWQIGPAIGQAHMPFRTDIPALRLHSHRTTRCTLFSRLLSPRSSPIVPFHSLFSSLLRSSLPTENKFGTHAGRFCMRFCVTRANRHGNLIFTVKLITNRRVNMMYREGTRGSGTGVIVGATTRLKARILLAETRPLCQLDKGTLVSAPPFYSSIASTETRRSIVHIYG